MLATREQLGRFSQKKNRENVRLTLIVFILRWKPSPILSIYTSAVTCACPCLTCVCVVIGQPAETSLLAAAASPALNSSLAVGRNPVALSAHCQITRVSFVPEKRQRRNQALWNYSCWFTCYSVHLLLFQTHQTNTFYTQSEGNDAKASHCKYAETFVPLQIATSNRNVWNQIQKSRFH